jgi:hypothetical protein
LPEAEIPLVDPLRHLDRRALEHRLLSILRQFPQFQR